MKYLFFVLYNLCVLGISAQYTYFNNTFGVFGDEETEVITNVEVVGDTIYLFGGIDNEEDPFSFLLRAIDNEGQLLIENIIPINNYETLIGQGLAVSTINQNKFIYTQGTVIENDLLGFAAIYDLNLDTIWMKTYDDYSPNTYFRSNKVGESSVFILGEEFGVNSSGTFVMEIDYEGNVINDNLLHSVIEDEVYRNEDLVILDNGLLIGGHKQGPFTAILTKTDFEGNIEWEYYADNFEDTEGEQSDTKTYRLTQLPNGDIVGAHIVWYEYYGTQPWNGQDPSWYRSLHLSKINVEDTSFYWEHDFFTDHEFEAEYLWKILPTDDNGILAMGVNENTSYLWILKVDEFGNEEWFNTYDAENYITRYEPYDVEQTSDGGYVIVGQYRNFTIEGLSKSWVMKIDACGDTEWQGCDYVGIQESIQSKQFKIYPNPATQEVQLEGKLLTSGDKVQIYNLYGKLVFQKTWHQNAILNISDLAKGMYLITVTNDTGNVIGQKLVVE